MIDAISPRHIEWCRKRAKRLLRAVEAGDPAALERLKRARAGAANHTSCLHTIAFEHGFRTWNDMLGSVKS